jgi:hypothetical protein
MLTLASLTLSIIVLSGVLGYGIARQFLPKEQAFFFGAMQVGVLLYPHFLGVFSYIGLPGKYSFVLAVPMILFSARTAWKDYSLAFIKELYFTKAKSIQILVTVSIIFCLLFYRAILTFPDGFYYIQDYKSYIADANVIIDYGYFNAPKFDENYIVNIGGGFPRPEVGFSLAAWSILLDLPPVEIIGPLVLALIFISILGFSGILSEGVGYKKTFFIPICILLLLFNPWVLRLSYATFSQAINYCALSAFLYVLVVRAKYMVRYNEANDFKSIISLLLLYWTCGISAWGATGLLVFTPMIMSAGFIHVLWLRRRQENRRYFCNFDIFLITIISLFSLIDFSAAITDLKSTIEWLNIVEVGKRPSALDVLGFVTNLYDVEIYNELVYVAVSLILIIVILVFMKTGMFSKLLINISFLTILSAITPLFFIVLYTIYFGTNSQWYGVVRLFPHLSTLVLILILLILINGLILLKLKWGFSVLSILIFIYTPLYLFSYYEMFLIDGLTLKGYSPGKEDWYLVRDVIRYKRKYDEPVLFEGIGGALGEALGASVLSDKDVRNDFSIRDGLSRGLLVVQADVGQSMQKHGYEVKYGRTIAVVAGKNSVEFDDISGSLNYPLQSLAFKFHLAQSYSIEEIKVFGNSISGLSMAPDPLFVIDLGGNFIVDVLRIHLSRNPHRLDDLFQIFYQDCDTTSENQVFESKIVNTSDAEREIIDFDLQGQCIDKIRIDPVTDPHVTFKIENIELMKQVY